MVKEVISRGLSTLAKKSWNELCVMSNNEEKDVDKMKSDLCKVILEEFDLLVGDSGGGDGAESLPQYTDSYGDIVYNDAGYSDSYHVSLD